jgi:Fe-S cluster biogenesis protein NfuA
MTRPQDLREVSSRIEGLLEELRATSDPRAADKAEQLVRLLMEFYGTGLEHIMAALSAEEGLVQRLVDDQVVASLLLIHGLHPVDPETRIQRALDKVRPYLGSHAGGVEFLGVDDAGRAHLRLEGTCNGCPSSTVTVKMAIERAIEEAAPDIVGVDVEGVAAPGLIQLEVGPAPLETLVCTVPAPAPARAFGRR